MRAPPGREQRALAWILLGGLTTAVLMAHLCCALHPAGYIPLLTPAIIGYGVASVMTALSQRLHPYPPAGTVMLVLVMTALAYGLYHALVQAQIIDALVTHLASAADHQASNPRREILNFMESKTGHTGWLAVLAFTATGEGAFLSPLGWLGRLEPGATWTLVAIGAELTTALAVARTSFRLRAFDDATPPDPDWTRQTLATLEDTAALQFMQALERGDARHAADALRCAAMAGTYRIELVRRHGTDATYQIEVFEGSRRRAQIRLTPERCQQILDAVVTES
jgi:hypothetical protein